MGKNGIFRSAIGGFNKKDVLQYIDKVTGEWDVERQELSQAAATAMEEAQVQRDVAAAQAATVTAMQEQLQQLQETLAEVTATAQTVPALREQVDALHNENETIRTRLEEANAAVAAGREHTDTLQRELQSQQGQLAEYRSLLGQSRTAHTHMEGLVRPMLEDVNRRTADTLEDVQAVIGSLLTQLGELQESVAERQQAQRAAADNDAARLAQTLDRWLERANRLPADKPSTTHFFR